MKNLFLFAVVGTLITIFVKIREQLINQGLWIMIAISSYFICTSGVVYTMINPVPMFRFEPDKYGKYHIVEYFMSTNRGQYGGEGYIVSSLALMISSGFFFLIKMEKFVEGKTQKRIATAVTILITFILIQTYLACYRIKTPWY